MNGSPTKTRRSDSGFTLVEIAVAIVILGLSLTALIGLNTSHLTNYFQQKKRVEASLYAKQLMTFYEIERDAPEIGEQEGPLFDELKSRGLTEDLPDLEQELQGWTYRHKVTSVDLTDIQDAMRRIDMSISWGERERESFSLTYFVKSPLANALTTGIAP